MATIKKQKLRKGLLTLGEVGSGKEFAAQVTSGSIEPSYSEGDTIEVLSGDRDTEAAEWEGTLKAEFFQDYDMEGLVAWTWENDGILMPFRFVPSTTGEIEFTGKVKVRPVTVGGDVGEENTAEAEWTITEKPEITAYTDGAVTIPPAEDE